MKNPAYSRTHQRALDFSRIREQTTGYPKNFISYGTVGHVDLTPYFARIEGGDVLVEVTLAPSGDEIIARMDFDSMDGGGSYVPLSYGQRVVVGFPNAETGDPVIISRCSDQSWPFPTSVAGLSTSSSGTPAPMFAFVKTAAGQVFAIETGDGADVLIHSGGSVEVQVTAGEQVLVGGRTHIGSGVAFSPAPVPPEVAEEGFVEPGEPGGAYDPLPNTNPTTPPPLDPSGLPLPADGVFRVKDRTQSNAAIDPAWWTYVGALTAFVAAWASETTAAGVLAPLYVNTLTAATTVGTTAALATGIDSAPKSGSMNTVADD